MIVAKMRDGSIIVALSKANLDAIEQGHPVSVTEENFGMPMPPGCPSIVVMFGDNEQAVADMLANNGKPKH